MLTFAEAVVLGIVQGVTEWLPVSSEGMTSLVMINFFGRSFTEALPVSIWLHLGTVLSAIVFFRKDIALTLRGVPAYVRTFTSHKPCDATITFLAVSTILTGIVGLPLMLFASGFTDFSGKSATAIIGALLIFTGIFQRFAGRKPAADKMPTVSDSFIAGVMQGFSALPGISRSGITVFTLVLRKFDASSSLKLSFLMSIPAVLAAEIGLVLMDTIVFDINSFVAVLFSFVFGLVTIDAFLKIAHKVDFSRFCIALGVLSVLVLFV